jgi:glycosyltransferase involved in cell wall biosynthesis
MVCGVLGEQQEMEMDSKSSPLVSIITPVYNNADDLPECIESVLAQTYQNWDYTIVNNCSTDGSGEVARRYAAKNPRIKVIDNQQFLRVIPNHNHALRQISPESKYCKVVFADDWIFPRCLEEMVAVAEEHPTVGIVGACGLENDKPGPSRSSLVVWTGLPYPSRFVPGREICRRMFLDELYVFGSATSVLYRSDLVRSQNPFYNESNFNADREAGAVLLKIWDFGFVHQILTFTRLRPGSLVTMAIDMQMDFGCQLHTLVTHGPDFLTAEEFEYCKNRLLTEYYNFLAVSVMRFRREKKFWEFHKRKLNETVGFSKSRLCGAVASRLCKAVLNPYETIEKLRYRRRPILTTVASQNAATRPPQVQESNAKL